MNVSFIATEETLTVVIMDTGISYSIDSDSQNWDLVMEKLKTGEYDGLEELLSVKKTLEKYTSSAAGIQIDDNGVKYNGNYINNYLTNKIVTFMKKDLPFKHLVNFLEKVMKNPSRRSTEELYKFLEHGNMPITPDGNFIGYKAIDSNWKDYHTGKCNNSIGAVLEMERNQVCDDPDLGCSYGYHVGTINYAKGFRQCDGRIVLVEVDPANVVSVPHDCNNQKLRTSKYTVVKEFERVLDSDFDEEFSSHCPFDDEDEDDDYDEREEAKQARLEQIQEEIDDLKYSINMHDGSLEELQGLVDEIKVLVTEREELE